MISQLTIILAFGLALLCSLPALGISGGGDPDPDPDPDPDAGVTVTCNLDVLYLSDNMPVWRDSYFTVTPAGRLNEITVAGTGNDPTAFTATVEAYDLAQGKGRVRVKSNSAGPKDFVAQLKLNGVVTDECTFQSFHLDAASAIDVQNINDPSHAAPLDIATSPAATLIRQPSVGTGLLVQHTEKGSITGSQYVGFNFQAAGTEAVFANPTDDTAETQVTGRVVVRYGTAPNVQEILCNIPAVPVTIYRDEQPAVPTLSVATLDAVGSPATILTLGEDMTLRYTVSGVESDEVFDTVDIEIRNADDVVVAHWIGEDGAQGDHDVVWEGGRWNTGTHDGPYANPMHNGYTVTATGHRYGETHPAPNVSISTELVLGMTLEDPKPSDDEISSGIDPDVLQGSQMVTARLKPTGTGDPINGLSTNLSSG